MTQRASGQSYNTGIFMKVEDDMSLAVNAFLAAMKRGEEGFAGAEKEKQQHLKTIQNRYWRTFFLLLSGHLARHRNRIELNDEERMLIDLGLVDIRMLGGDRESMTKRLSQELNQPGPAGSYYLSEWFWYRFQQLQLEDSVSGASDDDAATPASQLQETRMRVLNRLSGYFDGLPGIPRELSEAMRSGKLDNAILSLSLSLLRRSGRSLLLRRRNLWQLRDQVIAKARARAESQSSLKLFEALNEIYERDWRKRYDDFLRRSTESADPDTAVAGTDDTASLALTNSGLVMLEARQMRMRMTLAALVNGDSHLDAVLSADTPRLTKGEIAGFLPVLQSFDRSLTDLPPVIIVPGSGRGYFVWEIGCILLALRPSVGPEDSIATAFAFQRMLDDQLNRDHALRKAYEEAFPGSVFHIEFPVDYRAWLCRLTSGDISAMTPERRAFFRDWIGPDISGPMLPANLRNLGVQTRDIICRRLEKQIASGEKDYKLNRRLGTLYWQQGNNEAAAIQFNAAMQLAPDDGETLFTAGMFMRSQEDAGGANTFFGYGAERAANTLWGVYCQDALSNQF